MNHFLVLQRVPFDGCSLSFCCKDVRDDSPQAPAAQDDAFLDISDLLARSGITMEDLSELDLCPPLDTYREQMGVPECLVGLLEPIDPA